MSDRIRPLLEYLLDTETTSEVTFYEKLHDSDDLFQARSRMIHHRMRQMMSLSLMMKSKNRPYRSVLLENNRLAWRTESVELDLFASLDISGDRQA